MMTDLSIQPNQDVDCFSLCQDDDIIHICDWPALKAAIDKFQKDRGGRTVND